MLAGKLIANIFVCWGEEYMRRPLCALLAGIILLSFSACNTRTKESRFVSDESMKQDGDTAVETTTETTTETEPTKTTDKSYVQAPKNDSFDDFVRVVEKVFAALGDGYENLQYQSVDEAEQNKNCGIINMVHIWRGEPVTKPDDEPDGQLIIEIYIFEFDTESSQYKDLKVGNNMEFHAERLNTPAVVTAINKQYVISFYAAEFYANLLVNKCETLPEFTLGNLQAGYDAFIKFDPDKKPKETESDPEADEKSLKSFEQFVYAVVKALGEGDYKNCDYQDKRNAAKNKGIGIKNMVHINRGEYDMVDDNTFLWELTVDVWVFEFDTESDEYKELKKGGRVSFYERECINSETITAINGKYVMCIHAVYIDEKNKTEKNETAPEFTIGNAQKGYETFINYKGEEG